MVAFLFLSLMCGAASYLLAGWGIVQARRWWPSGPASAQLALGSSVFTVVATAYIGFCLFYTRTIQPPARHVDFLPLLARLTGGPAGVLKYLFMTWWGGAFRAFITYLAMRAGRKQPSKASGWLVYAIGFGGTGLFVMAEELTKGHDYPLAAWVFILGAAAGIGGLSFLLGILGDPLGARRRASLLVGGALIFGLGASWIAHSKGAARPLVPFEFALAYVFGTACFYSNIVSRVLKARASPRLPS